MVLRAAGRLVPYDLGPVPSWRNLRFPRSAIPADAVAVRVVAEDSSLTPGDWVTVTPPRVPELVKPAGACRLGSPVLGTGLWALPSRASSRCCTPTASPRFRSSGSPRLQRQAQGRHLGGRPQRGGLLGITDLLLRAHVMATYLSNDWGRDWGSLRKFDTAAEAAQLLFGTATHSGLWKPSAIRIGP